MRTETLPIIYDASTCVTGEKEHFLRTDAETGRKSLRLELKRLKAYGSPVSKAFPR